MFFLFQLSMRSISTAIENKERRTRQSAARQSRFRKRLKTEAEKLEAECAARARLIDANRLVQQEDTVQEDMVQSKN